MTTILRYPLSQWRGPKTYARRKKEPAAHSAQKVSMNVHIVRNQRENGTKNGSTTTARACGIWFTVQNDDSSPFIKKHAVYHP